MPTLDRSLKFSLLHVDCDLYEGTRTVLEHMFSTHALSDGCAILFDDWHCNRGSPQFGEQRAWAECVARYGVSFTDWGPYGAVGHTFIVHRT